MAPDTAAVQWVGVRQAAAEIGCSYMTVYRAIHARRIRHRTRTGVARLIYEVDLAHAKEVLGPDWTVVEPQ